MRRRDRRGRVGEGGMEREEEGRRAREAIAHLGGVWRVLVMVGNLQIVHGLNGTYISR